jgi:hypothetical protein
MGYNIKSTTGLINTKLTDLGRRRISQGNFNISYFQIGDSEVCYNCVDGLTLTNLNILEPNFNSQNDTGSPQSNKDEVKYPFYLSGTSNNTYGIPYMKSDFSEIFNTAQPRGFFTGTTAFTTTAYTVNSRKIASGFSGTTNFNYTTDSCGSNDSVENGDFAFVYLGNVGCGSITARTPLFVYQVTSDPGDNKLYVERPTLNATGTTSRVQVYPSTFVPFYDSATPSTYYDSDVINFESACDISTFDVKVWNMNTPWSQSPAGMITNYDSTFETFGSQTYIGTKEYLGYQTNSGQTDTSSTYYRNSLQEIVNVLPSEQKAIAIVHYTNQSIDNFYGEKFATEPYDPQAETTGLAINFSVSIPWLMWHKNPNGTIGETFYIDPDPAGVYNTLNLLTPYYIQSTKNSDMNDPGIRYYHLWDNHPNSDGYPNRVGKVFPDSKLIVFDDEEIVAAMSYKSNRSWTLPAPKTSRIIPNICQGGNIGSTGVLTSSAQTMYITYILSNSGSSFTNSLHCNYYSKVSGATDNTASNVSIKFGNEFPFMITSGVSGFTANQFKAIVQITQSGATPNPNNWIVIDLTSDLESTKVNGNLTVSGLTGTTFVIDETNYASGSVYRLSDYISIPSYGDTTTMNFGDEYFFYGTISTDITATIYEMKYAVNLTETQFLNSSNPTWTATTNPYVTEVGLYNSNKELMVVSKLQSPVRRVGLQQYLIKLDF